MAERSEKPLWLVWLGWTVLYGPVWGGTVSAARVLEVSGEWFVPIGAAFAILFGLRFRSWWWILGPPLVLLLAVPAAIALAGDYRWGYPTMLVAAVALPVLVLVAALGVGMGKWWQTRRA